jgi:hypothetical protein
VPERCRLRSRQCTPTLSSCPSWVWTAGASMTGAAGAWCSSSVRDLQSSQQLKRCCGSSSLW